MKDLLAAPEVGLGQSGQAVVQSYLAGPNPGPKVTLQYTLTDPTPLLRVRPDLGCLPIHGGPGAFISLAEAESLSHFSHKLRLYLNLAPHDAEGKRVEPTLLRDALRNERSGNRPEWLRAEAVPTLTQMLMADDPPVRHLLVELLAAIPGKAATRALAQRAVFDADADVRLSALLALRDRPAGEVRPVFLKAFRYPWSAPADHAAEALAFLGDKGAIPDLVSLLKLPDPAGPEVVGSGRTVVREVVRARHQTNCLLCHAPALNLKGPVLGYDPFLLLPKTVCQPATGGSYSSGAGRGGSRTPNKVVTTVTYPLPLRADVTFLRQDFSVQFRDNPLPGLAALPVRFDFLVRTRVVPPAEAARLKGKQVDPTDYPQREAALFALRELAGRDAGPTTQAWQALFPRAEIDTEASRLRQQLLQSSDSVQQAVLLGRWMADRSENLNGPLAAVASDLSGDLQKKVRDVLIHRLARGDATALRKWLADDDSELRRAALTACGRTKIKALVPDLIDLLGDADPADAVVIEDALHSITGEQLEGIADWKAWWEKNGTE
jgi:HEAT repeat protein